MTMSFVEFLQQLDNGAFSDEAGAEMAALVQSVDRLQKKGKLVLEFHVLPNGDSEVIVETRPPKVTAPKTPRRGSPMFVINTEGRLSATDPNQPDLGLKAVEQSSAKGAASNR